MTKFKNRHLGAAPGPAGQRQVWACRLHRLLALPLALEALALAPAGTALAAPPIVRISTDPYTNSQSQHQTEIEPDSLAHGRTVVTAFQVGRVKNGGSSNVGWSTSVDGGATWAHGFLPRTTVHASPAGPYFSASDASVAYDAKHNIWMISFLGLTVPGGAVTDVLVSRSKDGGLSWEDPVTIAAAKQFYDKNWSACDNTSNSRFYGTCYTEFDNASLQDLEQMSTSTDGGLNWTAAKPTADKAHGLGGQPLVQPNGDVVVPYVGLDSPLFAFTISSFRSTDGGNSWSASTLIANGDFHDPNQQGKPDTGIRATIPLPTAELDAAGRIYVAWSDSRFQPSAQSSDIVLSSSADGLTWTPVQRIPLSRVGSGEDHFIPGLAVDAATAGEHAKLALTYYYYPAANCPVATCQLNVGFVSSSNGGRTWSSPEHLAGPMSLTSLAATTQGYMVGDYISTSITPTGGNAVPVFAVAQPPSGGILDEAMYAAPKHLGGGANAASESGAQIHPQPQGEAGERPAFMKRPPPITL